MRSIRTPSTWTASAWAVLEKLGPLRLSFLASCLLSLMAIHGSITPNNDGMAYIEAARLYQDDGFAATLSLFGWNAFARSFMAIAIASLANVSGLSLQTAAYTLSVFFIAGTCTLLVAIVREYNASATWAACVAVLALPGLNDYRDYILREFGAWFFLGTALLLLMRWQASHRWSVAIAVQACICLAALFRPESMIFLLLLPSLYFISTCKQAQGSQRNKKLVLTLIGLALLLGTGYLGLPHLFGSNLLEWNPFRRAGNFATAASGISESILPRWSAKDAGSILALGLIFLIPKKAFSALGLLSLPLLFSLRKRNVQALPGTEIFALAALLYTILLCWFGIERLYITGRYTVLLALLLFPLVATGAHQMYLAFPKLRPILVLLAVVSSLAGVLSFSPQKTRFIDTTQWLQKQNISENLVHLESPEVAHLMNWSVSKAGKGMNSRDAVVDALHAKTIELAIIDEAIANPELPGWLSEKRLIAVQRFPDRRGRELVVLKSESSTTDYE